MTNSDLHEHRRRWAIRMARVGLPEHQIAFKLGVSIDELRQNFASAMHLAACTLNLLILENLARQALSPHYPAATRFWVRHRCWPKSESKNPRKSNKDNNKEAEPAPPRRRLKLVITGPNGERE